MARQQPASAPTAVPAAPPASQSKGSNSRVYKDSSVPALESRAEDVGSNQGISRRLSVLAASQQLPHPGVFEYAHQCLLK